MNGKLTLKELSSITGLSIATCSRALQDPDSVKESSRRKIQAALENSANGQTHTIAFVIPDITNQFFPMLFKGIDEIAQVQGYSLMVLQSGNNPAKEDAILSNLLRLKVAGILFICAERGSDFLRRTCQEKKIPIVFLDRNPNIPDIHLVTSDNYGGTLQAASYLLSLGHRDILYLGGNENIKTEQDRYQGFLKALKRGGVMHDAALHVVANYSMDDAYRAISQIIKMGELKFSAICASNDLMAFGAYKACRERGIRIPEDISIIGFDDLPSASLIGLTTIHQPFEEMGRAAILELMEMIRSEKDMPYERRLQNSIVIRESVRSTSI